MNTNVNSAKRNSDLELLARLQDALAGKPDDVPVEWKTAAQWAEAWKLSISRSRELIQAGVKGGLIERKEFALRTDSALRRVPHYRPK